MSVCTDTANYYLDANILRLETSQIDDRANAERKRLSMPAINTVGWHVPPHYDPETKRLEWGVKLRQSDVGKDVVNCSPGELGARTVEILDAVYRSATSGRTEAIRR